MYNIHLEQVFKVFYLFILYAFKINIWQLVIYKIVTKITSQLQISSLFLANDKTFEAIPQF